MSKFTSPNIPPTSDPAALQKSVVIAFKNLIDQLNNPAQDIQDMGNNRIINVAWPSLGGDAVPLDYLRKIKPKQEQVTGTSAREHYAIVFSGSSTITSGDTIPVYPVGHFREGNISEAVLYAITPPGTGGLVMDASVDGTSIFGTAGLTLGSGSNGPVDGTTFSARPRLKHNSVVKASVINGGGAADVTFALVVKR